MKTLGIVRRIDDLGRVVIPKEVRQNANIKEGDALEVVLVQMNGKWCPMFVPYDPNNSGVDLNKVEQANTRTVTMRDTDNDAAYYFTMSEGAYALLEWLYDHDAIRDGWDYEDGHHIETETFV